MGATRALNVVLSVLIERHIRGRFGLRRFITNFKRRSKADIIDVRYSDLPSCYMMEERASLYKVNIDHVFKVIDIAMAIMFWPTVWPWLYHDVHQ